MPFFAAEPAILHMQDSRGKLVDSRVMGDDEDATTRIEKFFLDKGNNRPARIAIERSGRLVHDENVRLANHCPRNGHALLFAPAQFDGRQIRPPFQADNFQILGRLDQALDPSLFFAG